MELPKQAEVEVHFGKRVWGKRYATIDPEPRGGGCLTLIQKSDSNFNLLPDHYKKLRKYSDAIWSQVHVFQVVCATFYSHRRLDWVWQWFLTQTKYHWHQHNGIAKAMYIVEFSYYSALHMELKCAEFLFVPICFVSKQDISHKLLSFPTVAEPQSECRW